MVRLSIAIELDQDKYLKERAHAKWLTVSEYVRLLIVQDIKQWKEWETRDGRDFEPNA